MGNATTGALGDRSERTALRYLVGRNLRLLARNFRCRVGEVDLVMLDGDCLVFVEVRSRRSGRFADPAQTVDRSKQRRLIRTAALFAARNRRFANAAMRFDVVAIEGDANPAVRWIRDAFRPDDSAF